MCPRFFLAGQSSCREVAQRNRHRASSEGSQELHPNRRTRHQRERLVCRWSSRLAGCRELCLPWLKLDQVFSCLISNYTRSRRAWVSRRSVSSAEKCDAQISRYENLI